MNLATETNASRQANATIGLAPLEARISEFYLANAQTPRLTEIAQSASEIFTEFHALTTGQYVFYQIGGEGAKEIIGSPLAYLNALLNNATILSAPKTKSNLDRRQTHSFKELVENAKQITQPAPSTAYERMLEKVYV